MSPEFLLAELLHKGTQLWVEASELCFRASKGMLTPELREKLVQNKTSLVSYIGEGKKYAAATSAQQRLWFMDRLVPDRPLYNIPALFRIQGDLNVVVLERCFAEIVRRHEAMRTVFTEIGGQPFQVILPAQPVAIAAIDLRSKPGAERASLAQRLQQEDACKSFDLANGPLFRLLLLRETDNMSSLLLTIHHIAFDGFSLGVFLNELKQLYQAYVNANPSPLPELTAQVADFVVWQNQFLQDRVLEKYIRFWKSQFPDSIPLLTLPTDRPRPAMQTYAGRKIYRQLPQSLIEALNRLGREENASLFMVLLAALQVLFYRYSGQTDIVIGTPLANRSLSKMEGLIGFFVNSLPIRGNLSANPPFRSVLQKTRLAALDVQTYQDLPLEKLVEVLAVERSTSYNALFQVMLAVKNNPLQQIDLPALQIEYVDELDTGTSKFDLLVEVGTDDPFHVSIEYASDLFEAATIERMLGHFRTLLEGIVADPEQHISALPLLTAAERQQLLIDWNCDEIDFSHEACLQTLFEAQVERTPEAVAVISAEAQLTYGELNRRSNQMAHHLRKLGIGPEVLVGVCMERTAELIVALLGVLKAGGAYVPLDPAYPPERMAFMLEDTAAPVLLTHQRLLPRLPQGKARIVCVDRDWDAIAPEDDQTPPVTACPDDLAYIIYTSGSTGRPKGVAIAHRSAVVLLAWAARVFPAESLKFVLASTSVCFDLSIYELFLPLSQGGTVVLADNALHLLTLPARDTVTLINTVPSAMAELVRSRGIPGSVQIVNLAGEPLKRSLVEQVYAHSNAHSVYDLYGPSEDTTYSTFALIDRDDPFEPSIGRPLSNTQAYILDGYLQPVPLGSVGELYLGGDGLSRGYLNRPDLTAEGYLPNPFSLQPGARMYKTGDLARYRPDGNVEFLGRIDHQVKIRGFRIELGEIEATLASHPAVRETVVVAREDGAAGKQLVAYLIPHRHPAPAAGELRGFLKEKLPEYMIPAAFVELDAFPLTANGKIDRRALPAPTLSGAQEKTPFVAPSTPLDEILAEIFSEVLHLERIGVHDNFFELGGHSLLATQVMSRVRDRFEVALPVRRLFEAPTIAELGPHLEQALIDRIKTMKEDEKESILKL